MRPVWPERFRELPAVARDDMDEVCGGVVGRALGHLTGAPWPAEGRTVIGMGGSGGNGVFADCENRFSSGDFGTMEKIGALVT
ncbi:hypothetical protein [Actinomadura sp. 3N407]|uniref:hypothetical protein n=1 Tax=Actinomadura sp. 3N407 TaxID=3457423 RepID=UPI003FCD17EE